MDNYNENCGDDRDDEFRDWYAAFRIDMATQGLVPADYGHIEFARRAFDAGWVRGIEHAAAKKGVDRG